VFLSEKFFRLDLEEDNGETATSCDGRKLWQRRWGDEEKEKIDVRKMENCSETRRLLSFLFFFIKTNTLYLPPFD
jgi:hypothetical protein